MPVLCRFYGMRSKLYYADHTPPLFHGELEGDGALITIDRLEVTASELSSRALGWVTAKKLLQKTGTLP